MSSPKSKPGRVSSSNENDPATTEPLTKRQRLADDPINPESLLYKQQALLDQFGLLEKENSELKLELTASEESSSSSLAQGAPSLSMQHLQQSGSKNEAHSVEIDPNLKFPYKNSLHCEELESQAGGIWEIFERLVGSENDEIRRGSWETAKAWYEEVHRAVSKFPILAQISALSKGNYFCLLSAAYQMMEDRFYGALTTASELDEPLDKDKIFIKTIMLLIEVNPYALLWKNANNESLAWEFATCDFRAGHEIFVWAVTTKFGWIMDSKESSEDDLFGSFLFICRAGLVDYDVMATFFNHHPRFLRTPSGPSGMLPIQNIAGKIVSEYAREGENIEPAIEAMATGFPESLSFRDSKGNTALHYACKSIAHAISTDHMEDFQNAVRACRILVERFPYALEYRDHQCQTPLELLDDIAYRKAGVQNVVLEMLRIFYPRRFSHDMLLVPLVRRASGVLEKEASMARTYLRVARVSMLLGKSARSPSRADDSEEVNEIYYEWSSKQLASMSAEMETTRSGNIASLRAEFA